MCVYQLTRSNTNDCTRKRSVEGFNDDADTNIGKSNPPFFCTVTQTGRFSTFPHFSPSLDPIDRLSLGSGEINS